MSSTTNFLCDAESTYMEQEPKYVIGGNFGTMGNPTCWKVYGGGGPVRGLRFRFVSSCGGVTKKLSRGRLVELTRLNKKNLRLVNSKLIHIVADSKVLILGYEIVKSKSGNRTHSIENISSEGIDLNWISNISKDLKADKFKFKPARRVFIPKKDKNKKRSLTISSPRDRVVQQIIYLVFNAVYEPSFLIFSHGSRPNRGNYSALRFIKYSFKRVKWCIEADIDNNFSSISHKVLMTLLQRRINCQKFLSLIKNFITAGYVYKGDFFASDVGIFQGNVISSILNNIYLYEFDVFMVFLLDFFKKGKERGNNSVWRKFKRQIGEKPHDLMAVKQICSKMNSKDTKASYFKSLKYVRHVGAFVVGVVQSRKEAADIQKKIKKFLLNELKLNLSNEKTLIIHFIKDFIFFLGVYIKYDWEKKKRIKKVRGKKGNYRKVRVTSKIGFYAPIKKIFEKATQNGFFKKKMSKFVPIKVGWLINLEHADIVKYYNFNIKSTFNHYLFANNKKSLGSFVHGLKLSCARTLALKYKVRFASRTYRRFGGKLACPEIKVELFTPKTFKVTTHDLDVNLPTPGKTLSKNWNNIFIFNNLLKDFIICGLSDYIEMHYVRKINGLIMIVGKKNINWFSV